MRTQATARAMPFTEEQMKQVFDTNIIGFAMEYFGKSTKTEAIEMILNCEASGQSPHVVDPVEKVPRGKMILPPKAPGFNRAIAYLVQTRGIDKDIVYALMNQNKIYQSIENKVDKKTGEFKTWQNCCFICYG